MIKKIAFASLALVASSSLYAVNCPDTCDIPAGTETSSHTKEDAGLFVVNEFDFSVSANVMMQVAENAAGAGASAASTKGRNYYTGSTFGGSVATCGDAYSGSSAIPAPRDVTLANGSGCEFNDPL